MNYPHLSDHALIALYQEGDERAFEVLLNRYKNKVFTTILLIVKQRETAEDLLQEVFIKVIQKIREGKYCEQGRFAAWIIQIAYNLAIDFFRKQRTAKKKYPTESLQLAKQITAETNDYEDNYLQNETFERLESFINLLPDSQREVVLLRHYSRLTFQEIARITNVSINTALGRMRYALLNLRKFIKENLQVHDTDFY
ncbi:MAG: sigma-70 family RNA polymerase sigma factor [Microscillaceae bacterium]|nr:sigma-70 family RNA polymerase sigma factor [Microscillaceae bacterium]MDW8461970.1 sigma-70 family RNA polymerase sigma factor [Cytophagales bacterium]